MKRSQFISDTLHMSLWALVAPVKSFFAISKSSKVNWQLKQFKDQGLAHFSYAVLVDSKIIIIDPARDSKQYYKFANENNATIIGVIETHPHADFASAHLEISKTKNAVIYASSLTKANYPHHAFDDGDIIQLSDRLCLKSLYTPGHAPDHISVLLQEDNKDIAVFSGDSLLTGDVGRPDLRDYNKANIQDQRRRLAAMMYHTIHEKFAKLDDEVIVYPAHGAGSLCGKAIRDVASTTIGYEKLNNYAFVKRSEEDFIELLLKELPYIPKYFQYDVENNIRGFPALSNSINTTKILPENFKPDESAYIIDGREQPAFKESYLKGSINIPFEVKFETWLGSIIEPGKRFYLIGHDEEHLVQLIFRTSNIGYEKFIKGAFIYDVKNGNKFPVIDSDYFSENINNFTIIDVRSPGEYAANKLFASAINIPLNELEDHIKDIPLNKPIVVHCSSGFRSAIGSSLIKLHFPLFQVFDLGSIVPNSDCGK